MPKLSIASRQFYLLTLADIKSDMAKRIMYSTLPAVVDPNQLMHSGGIADYRALAAAISGATDIIRLGTKAACVELEHFGGGTGLSLKNAAEKLVDKKDYLGALQICITSYGEAAAWERGYGGKPWLDISKCLEKIALSQQQLIAIKASNDPEAQQKIAQISQALIIQLNVFDGLSHNSASIMQNVIEEEHEEKYPRDNILTNEDAANWTNLVEEEIENVVRLMDAKELEDPADVYDEIRGTLEDSGDIHRYKDFTPRLNQLAKGRDLAARDKELAIIRIRKTTARQRTRLAIAREGFKKAIESHNKYLQEPKTQEGQTFRQEAKNTFEQGFESLYEVMAGINSEIRDIVTFLGKYPETKAWLDQFIQNVGSIRKQYMNTKAEWTAKGTAKELDPKMFADYLDVANKMSFYLDSI